MANNRFAERKKIEKRERYMDWTLLIIILFLLAFGLVMIFSTSSYEANMNFGSSTYYLRKQFGAVLLGLVFMIGISFVPYHWFERLAAIGYGISIILIIMIIPFGYEANGAKRWLRIMGFSLQPAEVAKVAMIVFLATIVCRLGRLVNTPKGFLFVLMLIMPICGMLWLITDNLSSAIIVGGIAMVMLFVCIPGYKPFIMMGAAVSLVGAATVFFITKNAGSKALGFRGERILAWLDPEAYASGKGFQTLQALYAIGSGGFLGKGLGESIQKLGFLPEAQNDMIFSIICEELGFLGALAVMSMFVILIWRLMIIADNAPDLFGAMLVVGVMGHVAIQVILNIGVVTNVIPNTGISLPFISYGGSSVLFLLAEMGIVLSVARGIRLKDL